MSFDRFFFGKKFEKWEAVERNVGQKIKKRQREGEKGKRVRKAEKKRIRINACIRKMFLS